MRTHGSAVSASAVRIALLTLVLFSPAPKIPGQTSTPSNTSQRSNEAQTLDLNTATVAELKALPGMGAVYAQRIVENRPYSAKNQLVTRGILPQAIYDGIRERIVAHRLQSPK